MNHKYNYNWKLSETNFSKNKGKVFSCFACGGGSTMGYKLSGFDVIGCNEIDKRMIDVYIKNHHPEYSFCEPIQTFKTRKDLPEELYTLDIFDGSPPCSSFSMAGNREDDWGKEKHFREGQSMQILDTLFFDFIDLGKKLQPKIIIAENVKGLLMGEAVNYLHKIGESFDDAGYFYTYRLLDASKMGVPQKRERLFFVAVRKDLKEYLNFADMFETELDMDLEFNEEEISVKSFIKGLAKKATQNYSENRFGDVMINIEKPCPTLATDINRYWLDENTLIDDSSKIKIGSFPEDYNFLDNNPQYIIGMSVPPVMMANIADRLYDQILSKTRI
jgi:DNA (cytosine-5)-methyltransferase 1